MKQCIKCKKHKLLSEFNRAPTNKDNLCNTCKICHNKWLRKHYRTHKTEYKTCHRKYTKTLVGYLRRVFYAMKNRCNNPKNTSYKNYGGRGINCLFKNSQELVNYVINELKIDPRGLTIDRIDNNGNYEYGNIRFVTQAENNKNRKQIRDNYGKYTTKRI